MDELEDKYSRFYRYHNIDLSKIETAAFRAEPLGELGGGNVDWEIIPESERTSPNDIISTVFTIDASQGFQYLALSAGWPVGQRLNFIRVDNSSINPVEIRAKDGSGNLVPDGINGTEFFAFTTQYQSVSAIKIDPLHWVMK